MPVTTPVMDPTLATVGADELQAPPLTVDVSVVVPAVVTDELPDIDPAEGVPSTETTLEVRHPVPKVYVMVAMPGETPVKTPEVMSILATEVLELDHTPPAGVAVSVAVSPVHTVVVPVGVPGSAYTVTIAVRLHPVLIVYDIVAVPGLEPRTMPVLAPTETDPVPEAADQVPPAVALDNVVVLPLHNASEPVIAAGNGLLVATEVI